MSVSRHCAYYKAVYGHWYLELGNFEHAEREDSVTIGPFASEDAVGEELAQHSNPGGHWSDDSGTKPVPTRGGDGSPLQKPSATRSDRRNSLRGWGTR